MNVDPFESSRSHRDAMYAARAAMAKTFRAFGPKGDRAGTCGTVRGVVELADHAGTWHATGFESCGLVHLCPACSVAPRLRRRLEIALAVQRWMARGYVVCMVTYALPHTPADPLEVTFERVRKSWSKALDNAKGRRWRRAVKLEHLVKATEVTFHRERGRHPHMHVLLFLKVNLDEFCDPWYGDRLKGLSEPLWFASKACGRDRPFIPSAGLDWTLVRDPFAADYLTKMAGEQGVDAELVQLGRQKDGRNGSIGAMALPYAIAQAGPDPSKAAAADAHVGWLVRSMLEYRRVTTRKPMLEYSDGFRDDLIPDLRDVSDEALVKMGAKLRGEYRASQAANTGTAVEVPVDGGDDAEAAEEPEGADEDDERPRTLTVAPDVWSTWARTRPPGPLPPDAAACRRLEAVGVWRFVLDLAVAAEDLLGLELRAYRHPKRRRVHVTGDRYDVPPNYVEVDAGDWLDLTEGHAPKGVRL